MALVVRDRVKTTTSTVGTGTITLGTASFGYQPFSVIGDGNSTCYTIVDSNTGDWEVGIGTYTASGTTLSRTTVLDSSNSGSLVSFAVGGKDVFVVYPSEYSVLSSNNPGVAGQVLTSGGSSAAPTWQTAAAGGGGLEQIFLLMGA